MKAGSCYIFFSKRFNYHAKNQVFNNLINLIYTNEVIH